MSMDILQSIAPFLLTPALAGGLLVYAYLNLSREEFDIYKIHIIKAFSEVKCGFTNNEKYLNDIEKQRRNHEHEMNAIRHSFVMGRR